MISVHDLSVVFRHHKTGEEVRALLDVSLEVAEGEFCVIIGPSGCGKTTLLNCIAGLVAPTAGEVHVRGRPVTAPGPDRAVVFQEYALFPWRTVWGNIQFGLELASARRAVTRDEVARRIREAVRLVGLEGFERHLPFQLSGGMRQRVGLARALVVEPQILLMDEPFGAIDAMTRELMQRELLNIMQRSGKTVVFVTHSIDEALKLGDRVVTMTARPGRVKAILPVDLPKPRTGTAQEASLAALRRQLWSSLEGEAQRAVESGF